MLYKRLTGDLSMNCTSGSLIKTKEGVYLESQTVLRSKQWDGVSKLPEINEVNPVDNDLDLSTHYPIKNEIKNKIIKIVL